MTTETNVLGTFTYGYDGVTSRLASATYPNGQASAYTYLDTQGDRRLETIRHRYPDGSTLSQFDYTYDVAGHILTWRQQADTTAVTWTYGYDAADQLTAAVKRAEPDQSLLQRYAYAYDPAGNRTSEQIDDAVTSASYDALNRLVSQASGGPVVVKGQLDEPAAVTINGRPATVTAAHQFEGTASVAAGTSTISIAAVDPSGNATTAAYEVDQASAGTTLTFDANGNLTADGTRTFEWDAVNRLTAVTIGTHRSEFSYDGLDRRVRIVEKDDGGVSGDAHYVWDRTTIAEERLANGEVNRFFADGEDDDGVAHYITRDHLFSVREVTDANALIVTRNSYDPYGRLTRLVGSQNSRFGFTGHLLHAETGLYLALYRAYDPSFGRWLSNDPARYVDGPNLFTYARNAPSNLSDPLGLLVPLAVPIAIVIEWAVEAGLIDAALVTADLALAAGIIHDLTETYLQAKGDKSPEELEKHLNEIGQAQDQLGQLQQELANAKGPKRREPIEKKIEKKEREIEGLKKEVKQKWPDKVCLP